MLSYVHDLVELFRVEPQAWPWETILWILGAVQVKLRLQKLLFDVFPLVELFLPKGPLLVRDIPSELLLEMVAVVADAFELVLEFDNLFDDLLPLVDDGLDPRVGTTFFLECIPGVADLF